MADFISQKLADGLNVQQNVSPQQAMQLRQTYSAPKQFIEGFPIANLLHINNKGRFHRDINMNKIHQSIQAQIPQVRQKQVSTVNPISQQSQNLYTQLATHPQATQQQTNQSVYQPNYAGQYVQPNQQSQPKQINLIQQQKQQKMIQLQAQKEQQKHAEIVQQQRQATKIRQMQKELKILQQQNQSQR